MRREIRGQCTRVPFILLRGVYAHRPFTRACVRACVRSAYISAIKGARAKKIRRWNRARHPAGPRADRRCDKTRLTRKLTVIPLHLFSLYASREITRREHVVFCIMQLGTGAEGRGEEPPPRLLLVSVTRDHALINAPVEAAISEDPLKLFFARCLELLSVLGARRGGRKTHFCSFSETGRLTGYHSVPISSGQPSL